MKYKMLAGSLTAHPNGYKTHLDIYMHNKQQVAKNLCEGLILHDQICIPIQDYITACGLLLIFGENNIISLLESNQIRFLRARHQLVVAKARNIREDIGLSFMSSDDGPHPLSSSHEESIILALNGLEKYMPLKNRKLLERLLMQQTDSVDINDCLKEIKQNTSTIFSRTSVANKSFDDFLGDLSPSEVLYTILGSDPIDINNPIMVMIGLATINYETHLLNKYSCISSSSTVNLTELSGLTSSYNQRISENFWAITELHKIPNLGAVILTDNNYCQDIIDITHSLEAAQFREWFHDNKGLNTKEIQQEFVGLIDKEFWFKTTVGSIICWGTATAASLYYGPLAGVPLGLANKLLGMVRGQSPKYFISDLQKITTPKK